MLNVVTTSCFFLGRTQRIYLSLQDGEKSRFDVMVKALQVQIQPKQQRCTSCPSFPEDERWCKKSWIGDRSETICWLGISKQGKLACRRRAR